MEIVTKDAQKTKEVGKKLADSLIESGNVSFTLALSGQLGSGKTTFVQGFADGLGIKQRIISPTFIIMRTYPLRKKSKKLNDLYHVDLYRLENDVEKEVINLGIADLWEKNGNIMIIEWAEKIKDLIPLDAYWITFDHISGDERKILMTRSPFKK